MFISLYLRKKLKYKSFIMLIRNKKEIKSRLNQILYSLVMLSVVLALAACSSHSGEHGEGDHDESDEESGTQYGLNDTCNELRNGIRLILFYDSHSSDFVGTTENTTDNTIQKVRVEVHLSNGIELGPTAQVDLAPDETNNVTLSASDQTFNKWSAHAETGSSEHGHEGEGDREHGQGGHDEHD